MESIIVKGRLSMKNKKVTCSKVIEQDVKRTGKEWIFETKRVRGIRTKKYGEPYTAIVYFEIINGELSIESLHSKEDLVVADWLELMGEIERLGFKEYKYVTYPNGVRTETKRKVRRHSK